MGLQISNRAIAQAAAVFAGLAILEALLMGFCLRTPGLIAGHARDALRPGMTVAEVLGETRGRYTAYAGPESDRLGKRGFTIHTFGIARDDSERGEVLRCNPGDLAARVEEEIKKEPGTWDLAFWYHTMDRSKDAYFTVTLGPDLRVLKVGAVGKTRDGHF